MLRHMLNVARCYVFLELRSYSSCIFSANSLVFCYIPCGGGIRVNLLTGLVGVFFYVSIVQILRVWV